MDVDAADRVVATYDRQEGTPMEDELLAALDAAGVDVEWRDPSLSTFVRPDALDRLEWDNPHLDVRTRVWGYPVRITADRIVVYAPE